MQQYLDHLRAILERGSDKGEAREGLLPTKSLFGYQWRHNLADGFPLITTKKMFWKGVVVELLWFLSGQTNVKWLNDNGVDFWNEDAYNYYNKFITQYKYSKQMQGEPPPFDIVCEDVRNNKLRPYTFEEFVQIIKSTPKDKLLREGAQYILGDCGKQYGWLWRNLNGEDQLANLLYGLIENPEGRRHIIDAWNPSTLNEMALHPCHCLVQFNCRKLSLNERYEILISRKETESCPKDDFGEDERLESGYYNSFNIPQYYLDCQMYQRSADMFLGVPFNIASYALFTHIVCEVVNMVPGEMIYSYGDSHIYGNVRDEVNEQLKRDPRQLPTLNINTEFWYPEEGISQQLSPQERVDRFLSALNNEDFRQCMMKEDIQLSNYNPHPPIDGKDKLLTGIKK